MDKNNRQWDDIDNYIEQGPPEQLEPPRKRGGGTAVVVVLVALFCLAALLVYHLANGMFDDVKLPLPSAFGRENTIPLSKTDDAGQKYIDETMFLGDSNTVRFQHFDLLPKRQVKAYTGIGVEGALAVAFRDDTTGEAAGTMAQAVKQAQPARVLITLGTNDIGTLSTESFIAAYQRLVQQIENAAPDATIIVNSIPPVAKYNVAGFSMEQVNTYNDALLAYCREHKVPFLDSGKALLDAGGVLPQDATEPDGLHLSRTALEEMLEYYRTHACW